MKFFQLITARRHKFHLAVSGVLATVLVSVSLLVGVNTASAAAGVTWTQSSAAGGWLPRIGTSALVFDNKMWIMGGLGQPSNDVWYSTDGVTWTGASFSTAWSDRYSHASVVFNNKMWIMGGYATGGNSHDVWYSTDGINWTQATAAAGWSVRSTFSSVVYQNKIWVIAGSAGTVWHNDVWHSADGVNWTQATAAAPWVKRYGAASAVYNDKMWIMGGVGGTYGNEYKNDVWYSTDGVTWTQATAAASWPARYWFTGTVFKNRMWIMGGSNYGGSVFYNDTWYSLSDIWNP
jgi:hypothetical protein